MADDPIAQLVAASGQEEISGRLTPLLVEAGLETEKPKPDQEILTGLSSGMKNAKSGL